MPTAVADLLLFEQEIHREDSLRILAPQPQVRFEDALRHLRQFRWLLEGANAVLQEAQVRFELFIVGEVTVVDPENQTC